MVKSVPLCSPAQVPPFRNCFRITFHLQNAFASKRDCLNSIPPVHARSNWCIITTYLRYVYCWCIGLPRKSGREEWSCSSLYLWLSSVL